MSTPESNSPEVQLRPKAYRARVGVLLGLAAAAAVGVCCLPPLPQPAAYHNFRDDRALLGVPNFLNVASNLPFVVVGVLGLGFLARGKGRAGLPPELVASFRVLFLGVLLTGFGSAYYHTAPDNTRLVWDRLPMAVAFMALYAAVLGERLTPAVAGATLWPLEILGAGSVAYWHLVDDLRPYLLVQFFPLVTIPLLLGLFPARYPRGADYLVALGWYALAKGFEELDGAVYQLGGVVSGHTLKHLAAAAGAYWLYRMLRLRSR